MAQTESLNPKGETKMATAASTRVKKATSTEITQGDEIVGLRFQFADRAQTVREVLFSDLPSSVLNQGLSLGIKTKLQNSYNFSSESGLGPEDAVSAFDDQWDALVGAEWSTGRASGPSAATIAEALSRVLPEKYPSAEDALVVVRAWSDEEKAAKLKVPALSAMLIRIKAEKALAKADAMTSELGDFMRELGSL